MEEIKISDLSIGDWVRHTFYEENLQIKRIDGESERLLVEKGLMSVSCHLDHFKPIPLTPEILEKNGFVYSKVTRWYNCELKDTQRTRIGVHFFGGVANRIEISSVDALDEDWNTIDVMINKPIKGVHQLQHALRLAGVGKEIEL